MREKILLCGDSNTSKTLSLVSLAILMPDRRVAIFDPDDGTSKVLGEMGLSPEDLPNLTIYPVRKDWEETIANYEVCKAELTEDDWLCMDMLGRFWDLSQQYYSVSVFGESPIEHLMTLKKQAGQVNFGGFDGLTDWVLIKRLHNEQLLDDATLYSQFNVMATTSIGQYLPIEKVPQTGIRGTLASNFGIKIEGEKHNLYRFDSVAIMYRGKDGSYRFRLAKDRGRAMDVKQEFDITGKSFMEVYAELRELEL